MKCPYREYILHDIMDAINNLHLDAHTVESSTVDGVLTLAFKAKVCHSNFFIFLLVLSVNYILQMLFLT